METSYLDYALSVIVARALPDVRDGLKPVNRRILFAMHKLGIKAGSKYKKSAFIVGEVMGKYHPHGDSSIYMAMVRTAQYFSLRYPLVDGQGNFGSIDGDSPAAMRYTEARMEKISEYILSDIEKETVDRGPNYDGSFQEPKVLPSRLPNLLLNGVSGIAVGMATNIPPHNLGEVVDALIHLIDNNEATIDDLCEYIKGPDFPTKGTIYDVKTIKNAYATGRGSVIMRGEAEITEDKKGKKKIIITEIPYQVNKANLIIKIAELVKDKKVEWISDIRDESAKEDIRIVIDLKRDAFPQKILNQIFKLTPLQSSFPFNMVALAGRGIQPRLMDLKAILKHFLDHRFEVITRRTEYELKVAKARMHILEGFRIALDNIDEVIKIIKGSKSKVEAKGSLIKRFEFSEKQADAILEMKLHTLTNLETQKILDELKEKLELIDHLEGILAEDVKIYEIVQEELLEIKEKFADVRLTKVIPHKVDEFRAEDLIPNDEEVIILTKGNYIKRIPVSNFKAQKRGGVGIKGAKLKEEDEIKSIIYANSHDEILVFSSKGIVFKIKAFEIPQTSRIAKGTSIYNIIDLPSTSDVATLVNVPSEDKEKWFLVFATKKGLVKKTDFGAYQNIRKNGLLAVKLKEEDELAWAKVSFDNDYCLLITKQGKSIVFETNQVRAMGRNSSGVRGIKLKGDDQVIEMDLLDKEVLDGGQKVDLLTVSKLGFSKRTLLKNFRIQGRGGTGIKAMNINSKTGEIVKAKVVCNLEQDLLLMASSGNIIRLALKSMNRTGRVTQGVKLIKLKKDEYVASVTLLNMDVDGEK